MMLQNILTIQNNNFKKNSVGYIRRFSEKTEMSDFPMWPLDESNAL